VCKEIIDLFLEHKVDSAAYLTAFNPYSELTATSKNERAQRRLIQDLRSRSKNIFLGAGKDPSGVWPEEPSVLALDMSRSEAVQIGERYRQNAVVWIWTDGIPELVLLM
jgi:hypothetical protein